MALIDNYPYLTKLQTYRQLFNDLPSISDQIDLITSITWSLTQKRLPQHSLYPLGLSNQDYLNGLLYLIQTKRQNSDIASQTLKTLDHLLHNFREFLEENFGIWALFNQTFIKRWVQLYPGLHYLEIMAGNGLLSLGLKQFGQSVLTTDDLTWSQSSATGKQPLVPVISLDALSAMKRFAHQVDALVMVWSQDHNPVDYQVLQLFRKLMPHKYFFVIGEKFGATGSTEFWQSAHYHSDKKLMWLNQSFPHFDLMRDRVYLVN